MWEKLCPRKEEGRSEKIILGSLTADLRSLCILDLFKVRSQAFSFVHLSFSHQDQTRCAQLNKNTHCMYLETFIYFVVLGFCLTEEKTSEWPCCVTCAICPLSEWW